MSCASYSLRFHLILVGLAGAAATVCTDTAHAQMAAKAHMSEATRASIQNVVVIAGESPTTHELSGTYEKETAGLVGGADAGSQVGTISKDVGSVPVSIPIPGVALPGAIIGGVFGASQRELQEFRDAMTKDLANAASQPLRSEALATDVYHGLRVLPSLDTRIFTSSKPLPENTQAVLYVSVDGVNIDVQGKDAILTTTARATLMRVADGTSVDARVVQYQDRDTLDNWTGDDNALWHSYANFARHYLGRELSAQLFGRVELDHELIPVETDSVDKVRKRDWQFVSKSTTPTLAWDLELLGTDTYGAWVDEIDESNTYFDLEIYNNRTLVYDQQKIMGSDHTLTFEIEDCMTYRWSVRPSYHVDGDIKNGEWMRPVAESDKDIEKGNTGRKASEAHAYIQDFASLEIKCARR